MSDSRDFEIEMPPGAEPADATGSKPIVVIQYRNRGLSSAMLPPLLILLAAVLVSSYQRQAPLRLPSSPRALTAAATESRGRTILVEPSDTGAVLAPLELRTEPAFATGAIDPRPAANPPAPVDPKPSDMAQPAAGQVADSPIAAEPASDSPTTPPTSPQVAEVDDKTPEKGREILVAPSSDPFEVSPAPRASGPLASIAKPSIGFDREHRPEPAPQPPPSDPPLRSKEEVMQEIETEAAEKESEQEQLRELKGNVRLLQIRQAWLQAQQDRYRFHVELGRLLRKLGDDAGPDIDALCDRFGRETLPEIRNTVRRQLKRASAGQSRQATIDMMRRYGYPEPLILEYLTNQTHHSLNSRNGPRDPDEVRVFAARSLLSCPVAPPTRRATTPAGPGASSSSALGTRSTSVPGAPRRP